MISTTLVVFLIRGIAVIGDIGVYHPNLYIEIPWYVVVRGAVYSLVYITALFELLWDKIKNSTWNIYRWSRWNRCYCWSVYW